MKKSILSPQEDCIKLRNNFPQLPDIDLPFYPRSGGITNLSPRQNEINDGNNKNFVQLNLIISGYGQMWVAGERVDVQTGNLIIQYPLSPRKNNAGEAGLSMRWLTFDGPMAEQFIRSYNYPDRIKDDSLMLERYFIQFESMLSNYKNSALRYCIAQVTTLLARIGENLSQQFAIPSTVQKFRDAAEKFYADSSADVNMICAYLNLHRGTVSKIFKESNQGTPGECLREIRVRHALELLALGISVHETAHKCGFVNPSYFTQAIHRITGHTPYYFMHLS